MIKPEVLDALVAAGCSAEQIAAAVKADQARSSGAERQARYRARKKSDASQSDERDVTSVTVTADDDPSSPKEKSPTPPKEITPPTGSEAKASYTRDFEEFWTIWKSVASSTGKFEAFKAWKARKPAEREQASRLAANYFRRWRAEHPEASPLHAATYLNKRRWLDMLDDAEPAGDLFVAQSEPNFLPLRGRYRSEHNGQDPPPAVQDSASGALFPAAWVIASRASMGRQANG